MILIKLIELEKSFNSVVYISRDQGEKFFSRALRKQKRTKKGRKN